MMGRFHHAWNIEPIIEAAEYWKQIVLLGNGSVFSDDDLWTDENLDALQTYFVENLAYGEGNFMSRLESQFQPTSHDVNRLMAEVMWFHLLAMHNLKPFALCLILFNRRAM